MYNLSNIALAISDRELSRKELKHYLKYHLKAFARNYLNNRRSFTEDEFNKIVAYLKTSKFVLLVLLWRDTLVVKDGLTKTILEENSF